MDVSDDTSISKQGIKQFHNYIALIVLIPSPQKSNNELLV